MKSIVPLLLLASLNLADSMVFSAPKRATFIPSPLIPSSPSPLHPVPSPAFTPPEMFTSSIDGTSKLTFSEYYHHQMSWMHSTIPGLTEITSMVPSQFVTMSNPSKKVRIVQRYFTSDLHRKIRILYYDGGPGAQVFNSLMYPRPCYDAPVLGVDLLQFGGKKHLTVIDFQPLHGEQAETYEGDIKGIKADYPELGGKMSKKVRRPRCDERSKTKDTIANANTPTHTRMLTVL